jgi:hypothetical protein
MLPLPDLDFNDERARSVRCDHTVAGIDPTESKLSPAIKCASGMMA